MLFFLKKLVTSFILPPGFFIVIFALGGVYLVRKRRTVAPVFLVSALCLYLLSIEPVKDLLMLPLEESFPFREDARGDVIVMLGGGVNSMAPDLAGMGVPSEDTLERLVCSYRLWKKLRVPVIVSGGRTSPRRTADAEVAARVLSDMGVREADIIKEEESRDTAENSYYSGRIIHERGFRSPVLVTSAYHMRRAVRAFRDNGIEVTPLPCGYRSSRRSYGIYDFLPTALSLQNSAKALKEYLGLLTNRQ